MNAGVYEVQIWDAKNEADLDDWVGPGWYVIHKTASETAAIKVAKEEERTWRSRVIFKPGATIPRRVKGG